MMHYFLILQLISTAMMTGIIWLVQQVQYPLFVGLDPQHFIKSHQLHSSRITWVVAPLMLIELITSSALLFLSEFSQILFFLIFILTLLIWALTFFISVPRHNVLSQNGYDLAVINSLIGTNWARTLVYTIKMILVAYLFY